ncbi:MAG: M17 family peptidase N-terminal domain-containing protein, partial [Croceibacterium sp.]
MQITFRDTLDTTGPRLLARLVEQDRLPLDLDRATVESVRAGRFTGKTAQLHESFQEQAGRIVRLALVGVGTRGDGWMQALERAGAALAGRYQASGETALVIDLTGSGLLADDVAALLLGLRLRNWRYDTYRTTQKDEEKASLVEAVVVGAPAGSEAAWKRELALAEGVEFTRELVTEPANVIYPESFVERCQKRFEGTGAELSFLDEAQMLMLGMGALLGVAQGSVRAPRLLVIKWLGGAEGEKPTVFVGKGVTFDTGGISIKPAAGMEDMKWDMGGAGAVAGAMLA